MEPQAHFPSYFAPTFQPTFQLPQFENPTFYNPDTQLSSHIMTNALNSALDEALLQCFPEVPLPVPVPSIIPPLPTSPRVALVESLHEIQIISQAETSQANHHCKTTKLLPLRPGYNKGKFVCPQCHKSFTKKYNLMRHESQHFVGGSLGSIKCTKCDSRFTRSDNLNSHMRAVHPGPMISSKHDCPHCPKSYSRKGSLTDHLRLVHPVLAPAMMYTCASCPGLTFPTRRIYNKHFKHQHSAYAGYKCLICNREFTSIKNLTTHFRRYHIHTELADFQCSKCDYHTDEFEPLVIMKHYLKEHKRQYLPCFFCKTILKNSEREYLRHVKIHEPQDECKVRVVMETIASYQTELDLSFKDTLKEYNDKINKQLGLWEDSEATDDESHKCNFCESVFPSKREARKHYKKLHLGEDLPECLEVSDKSDESVENLPLEFEKVLKEHQVMLITASLDCPNIDVVNYV